MFLLPLTFLADGPQNHLRIVRHMLNQKFSTPARGRSRLSRRLVVSLAVVISLGLGATACGSSSKSKAANTPASTTTSTAPGSTAAGSTAAGSAAAGSTTAPGSTAAPGTKEVSPTGDIPDNQAYVAYAPPGQGYSVKVPEGWARRTNGGATVFTDKLNSIRMQRVSRPNAPTVATVTAAEVPKLAKSVKNYQAGKVSTVRRTSGGAVLVTYEADGPADPVTTKVLRLAVERYEFWRSGHSVILTLSGAKGADNVDPWKTVTDSFGWKA
jgi:hypothetical protein